MAQFDVHRNLGREREAAPYLLVVQSARFDRSAGRVVIPLFRAELMRQSDPHFNVRFTVEATSVVMDPLQILTVPAARMSQVVTNLTAEGDRIIRALDLLISRAYG